MNLNGKVERLEQRAGGRDYGPLIEQACRLLEEAERCDDPKRVAELEREVAHLPIPIEVIDAEIGAVATDQK